jgi:hypothetical protein
MACGLSGRNDSAGLLVSKRHDHKEHVAVSHSDDPNPLFVVREPCVYILKPNRVFQCGDGVDEINVVLTKVFGGFAIVPFVLRAGLCTEYR